MYNAHVYNYYVVSSPFLLYTSHTKCNHVQRMSCYKNNGNNDNNIIYIYINISISKDLMISRSFFCFLTRRSYSVLYNI